MENVVEEFDSGTSSVCSDFLEHEEKTVNDVVKKLIKPDDLMINKLLNFDEVLSLNFKATWKFS